MAVRKKKIRPSLGDLTPEDRRLERKRRRAEEKLEAGERPLTPKEERLLEEAEVKAAVAKQAVEEAEKAIDKVPPTLRQQQLAAGVQKALQQQEFKEVLKTHKMSSAEKGRRRREENYPRVTPYVDAIEEAGQGAINEALRITGYNRKAAAKLLGLSRKGLIKAELRTKRKPRTGMGGWRFHKRNR